MRITLYNNDSHICASEKEVLVSCMHHQCFPIFLYEKEYNVLITANHSQNLISTLLPAAMPTLLIRLDGIVTEAEGPVVLKSPAESSICWCGQMMFGASSLSLTFITWIEMTVKNQNTWLAKYALVLCHIQLTYIVPNHCITLRNI